MAFEKPSEPCVRTFVEYYTNANAKKHTDHSDSDDISTMHLFTK
jgi:hypothetical protein